MPFSGRPARLGHRHLATVAAGLLLIVAVLAGGSAAGPAG